MKLHKLFIVAFSVSALLFPVTGFTGALDRGPAQQRYNQAADEMIRVPGVVGMYESDAMAVLQQAGVAPHIEYANKYKEDLVGREGTVIDQEPGAAGITMLGSTVTIIVYWPASMGPEPTAGASGGQPANDGGGQWGEPAGAAPPPSNQAPAPQWGGGSQPATGSQPASGGGWAPPPVPAPQPYVAPAAPQPATPPPVSATPVKGTVTPVSGQRSTGPAPIAATPVQPTATQADQQQPASSTINMTPVQQTVTPIGRQKPSGTAPIAATPVQPTATQTNQQPAAPSPIVMTPVQPTATQADQQQASPPPISGIPVKQTVTPISRQRPSRSAPIAATPVQPTATQAGQQQSAPSTITMTPVQQTVTSVNQSRTIAEVPNQDSSCTPGSPLVVKIFEKAVTLARNLGCKAVDSAGWGQCVDDIEKAGKLERFNAQLTQLWNHLVANSSLNIGPRDLTFGKTHNGTIVGSTGRMFITPVPINGESINIKLTKKAGKSRTFVTVCSYLPEGVQNSDWKFESPRGNKNKGQVWAKNLANMQGKILSIHIDGKSAADTFQYSVVLGEN